MRPPSLLSYCQCRHTLLKPSSEPWITLVNLSFRRHRSGGNSKNNKWSNKSEERWRLTNNSEERWRRPTNNSEERWGRPTNNSEERWRRPTNNPEERWKRPTNNSEERWRPTNPRTPFPNARRPSPLVYDIPKIDPNNIPAFFEVHVKQWSRQRSLPSRLLSFGIQKDEIKPLLDAFVHAVTAGELSTSEGHHTYVLSRFTHHLDDGDPLHAIDAIYTTILYTWASETAHSERLRSAGISQSTINRIRALAEAGDRLFPAEEFPDARKFHRKIIMHVGPTNSGKTHNALRALAAAATGVYAGPLRLLAHEIWERLNLGQIVPQGVEEEPPKMTTVETDTAPDVATASRPTNPKYVRPCNMRTGEEQRIVDEYAPLTSCTVEMLGLRKEYDVAVIDEIQMLNDPDRGGAWTIALLGVCAKEVHLCGEETAVPVVEALLRDTGDEIIINRYQRLSPLYVQEESLNGDWSRVKKGDCVVTFARSNIFKVKSAIEAQTPLRCAVVYGRLPPEIRSEQAALFNDPNSGYDVLIGSDAIGMGLNLKIRRVIFEATSKYHGTRDAPLSISQTKQIAGRAGRYGLHGNDQPGGYVTALLPDDISHIQKAVDAIPTPLKTARIGISSTSFFAFSLALPPNSSTKTILSAYYYISRIPAILRQQKINLKYVEPLCNFIDARMANMPARDTIMFLLAPIPLRDVAALEVVQKFLRAYQDEMSVDLWEHLEGSSLVAALDGVERLHAEDNTESVTSVMIAQLESLHRAVMIYMWMTFRRPMAWHCVKEVAVLKLRLEKALDWGLRALTKLQPGKDWERYVKDHREKAKGAVIYTRQRSALEKYLDLAQAESVAAPIDGASATEPCRH
ncbi:hypothetical protein E4T56_gene12928 [Termitomyces sp. T112]|nr:hypothetical protein E4T56_gene12928 [Termitomyces sp. T112]